MCNSRRADAMGVRLPDNPAMNEDAARQTVLARAVETTDAEQRILSAEDRATASRAAAELARWHATENRSAASVDAFVAQRAALLVERLAKREPGVARAGRALAWRPWIGVALPLLALAAGAVFEQIADRRHVNLLAFPLLGLLVWNLAVYASLAVHFVVGLLGHSSDGGPRQSPPGTRNRTGPRAWLARLAQHTLPSSTSGSPGMAVALSAFASDWARSSARLTGLRAARVLHLAAAAFAIGAVAGMYVRGLAFDYRVGWESTFLDAPQVHAILATVFWPAAKLLGMPLPSIEEVAALRFATGSAAAAVPDQSAARWIHLYAATVAIVVIIPRLALGLLAGWRERRIAMHFPIDYEEPYFRRLTGPFTRGSVRVRVLPYSFTVDEPAVAGLRCVATALLGDGAEVAMRPSVPYGKEIEAATGLDLEDAKIAASWALFSLAATPENESHGLFLDTLKRAFAFDHGKAAELTVLIDESGYRRRLGDQAGSADRLVERRSTWILFCEARGLTGVCVDLIEPDLAAVERDFGAARERTRQ